MEDKELIITTQYNEKAYKVPILVVQVNGRKYRIKSTDEGMQITDISSEMDDIAVIPVSGNQILIR